MGHNCLLPLNTTVTPTHTCLLWCLLGSLNSPPPPEEVCETINTSPPPDEVSISDGAEASEEGSEEGSEKKWKESCSKII